MLGGSVNAATLYRVRFGHYPDKIRAVFDFDDGFTYESEESKDKIVLRFKDIDAGKQIESYVELNDLIVRYFEIERDGEDLKVTIPLSEPIEYNIFYLNYPPRLVVDFGREYLNITYGGTVAPGIEHLEVKKGIQSGQIKANVLRVNLDQASVRPALARKQKSNLVDSFINIIMPWTRPTAEREHFYLDKVNNIVDENGGIAGINGTFFASTGSPLGALMIDREIVSSPIYDRTAFFLDENNTPYIDNIFVSSYFYTANRTRYKITGINQGRGSSDTIMYTPVWGESTGTNQQGIEIVVSGSKITKINVSNSNIPQDGYVISVSGPQVEVFSESIKVGERVDTAIKIIPYTTSPKNIVNLISGGPRILKHGRVYVSKHEERFKMDIARGRAARTAIGLTKDHRLLLVTVDGRPRRKKLRQKNHVSIGASLEELSNLMISLGAVDAMNLDGGSSSTMVIKGKSINQPTAGYQRRVSNALIVQAKEKELK
ncbi:MAG: phosphodiester glycosidase family protein [Candidatus Margulisiibacteriota bacterium]|nr:phosphodiester glycosidase family protein [Candidatus Margulisiibacteriota bacterium]